MMAFGALSLVALVATGFPLPWQVVGTVASFAAVVAGARALRALWRTGLRGPLLAIVAMGTAVTALVLASSLSVIATWPIQVARQECLERALTVSARDACEEEYRRSLDERLQPSAA